MKRLGKDLDQERSKSATSTASVSVSFDDVIKSATKAGYTAAILDAVKLVQRELSDSGPAGRHAAIAIIEQLQKFAERP
jgi:hypothetical protein